MGKVTEERLNLGNDEIERIQTAPTTPRRPGHSDQPHHRLLPGIRRTVGGAGPTPSPTGEYPSLGRRPPQGPGPDLRQRSSTSAPVASGAATGICSGCPPALSGMGCRWGVQWRVGLERYEELKGLDWSWLSRRHDQIAPGRGEKPAPTPLTAKMASSAAC